MAVAVAVACKSPSMVKKDRFQARVGGAHGRCAVDVSCRNDQRGVGKEQGARSTEDTVNEWDRVEFPSPTVHNGENEISISCPGIRVVVK